MSGVPIFSRRMLIGWIAAAAVTFAVALFFMTGGDSGKVDPSAVGPTTFSRSAIGYAGLVDILQRLDIPTVKSRFDALTKLSPGSVLVIAEPLPNLQLDAVRTVDAAPTALLILPKWAGTPSREHRGWIGTADLFPDTIPGWALTIEAGGGEIVRLPSVATWQRNMLGPVPSIAGPVQLMHAKRLRPVVASEDGMLIGELTDKGRRLWVLSDPDVLANHGLGREGNAAFAVALVEALRRGDGAMVFDETIHGYATQPVSPLRLLFKFPFTVATIQGAVAIALLLWATVARFGAPERTPPALDAGKQGLIRNAAKLLAFAGHQNVIVRRYVQATLRDTARELHLPRGLGDAALTDTLRRVGEARGVTVDCGTVLGRLKTRVERRAGEPSPLLRIARDIHQWKREIMDGPSRNPRRR